MSDWILEYCREPGCADAREWLALWRDEHPDGTPLDALCDARVPWRVWVAWRATDPEVQRVLARDRSDWVRCECALHATDPEAQRILMQDTVTSIQALAVRRAHIHGITSGGGRC